MALLSMAMNTFLGSKQATKHLKGIEEGRRDDGNGGRGQGRDDV